MHFNLRPAPAAGSPVGALVPQRGNASGYEYQWCTFSPIREYQNGLSVQASVYYYQVASLVVGPSPIANTITAAANGSRRGDVIRFTSGVQSGIEVFVLDNPDANTITLSDTMTYVPSPGDTFLVLRPRVPIVDANGNVVVSGTITTAQAPNANASFVQLTVTAAESSSAAPANAVGFILESESDNAINMRWGISNSAGPILGATTGMLMEPGRDTGYIPAGFGTYVHVINVSAGTNKVGLQWVLSS
jgi:hypothetical protein